MPVGVIPSTFILKPIHRRVQEPIILKKMAEPNPVGQDGSTNSNGKKQILLNAFDMSTVGHLSPGQWKVS